MVRMLGIFCVGVLAVQGVAADPRADYLKKHAVPIRSIDPADEEFADLEPIAKAIGDARLVWLGEQTHGDGATFHAKTRLIKFLHQKHGFDVLAFESGLYDCRKAWQILREGKTPAPEAVAAGVFGIWTQSQQVQPLIEYLGKVAKEKKPLELAGVDCQFTGSASTRHLRGDVSTMLDAVPAAALTSDQRDQVRQAFDRMVTPDSGLDDNHKAALIACRKALNDLAGTKSFPAEEVEFWRQFLASALALGEAQPHLKKRDTQGQRKYGRLRDEQMAKNLIWLAQARYPGRKIIVWAASFHLLRNQAQVLAMGSDGKTTPIYSETVTMGHDAWKVLGKEVYSIGFTAAQGEWHLPWWDKGRPLAPVREKSLEEAFLQAGCENAFLDLRRRGPDGDWLSQRMTARPLGHADMEADWPQVFDGFVFTKTMVGSKRVAAPAPPK